MYIGRDFPIAEDGSARVYGFDLADTLSQGETITSVSSAMIVVGGSDPTLANFPTSRFIGAPAFNGTRVTQEVVFDDPTNSLAGNVYVLILASVTSFDQQILTWSRISIERGHKYPLLPSMPSPSSAQIIVLPTPAPKYLIPALIGYAGQDFPVTDQDEIRLFGFDLTSALSPTEQILMAQFALSVASGSDLTIANNPAAYFVGSPIIGSGLVQQMIAWPSPLPILSGNVYDLQVAALTSFNQGIETWSRISINAQANWPVLSPPTPTPPELLDTFELDVSAIGGGSPLG